MGAFLLRVIGLTGGIACGKSTVSAWLRRQPDCAVIDGDELARELTAPGGSALPLIREAFGKSVFYPDGTLNRRSLGRLIFEDAISRECLDRLMAPLLEKLTTESLIKAEEQGNTLCFLDYPLLFEKGYDRLCSSVWCVYLPASLQLQRLIERDGLTQAEAENRMKAVLSSEEKASRSSVVIDNSGSVQFTLSTLPPLLEEERRLASAPRRRRSRQYQSDSPADQNSTAFSTQEKQAGEVEFNAVMDRPHRASREQKERKIAWSLPSWLMILLIVSGFLLAAGFAAQMLMSAFLARQTEIHRKEADSILANYPLEYRKIIEGCAAEYNLSPAFVTAIIRNESSFQPSAESSVGARGLMQLMPDTAEWIAGKIKLQGYAFDRMYDPESNVRFGCWYLNYLASLFHGDPLCVACAYHAGQGQVTAWLSDSRYSSDGVTLNLDKLIDGPTKTYAGRVIKAYGIYQALYFDGVNVDAVLLPRPGR